MPSVIKIHIASIQKESFMSFDATDSKDMSREADVSRELADTPRISSVGQKAMQGEYSGGESDDAIAALEARVEEARIEAQAREAARWVELERQAAARAQEAALEAKDMSEHLPPEMPDDHQPQIATTELGKARQVEAGVEMSERKLFSDIDETREREGSIYRPGRLR